MKEIFLITEGKRIPAMLNDTKAAQDFGKRLPFQVTCHDSGIDYCGTVARGRFDPLEFKIGWKNGDIMLSGGWFALLYDGEERSKEFDQMMIIGHFDDIETVRNLPATIRLTVTERREKNHSDCCVSDGSLSLPACERTDK